MKNISQRLIDLLNYRIEQEESSSRLYKSMAVWLDFKGYSGAAKLFNKYAEEELKHAGWAYQYLLDLDIMPNVPAIEKPQTDFAGLIDIINKTYEHEQLVTNQCQELASAAFKEGDYMTLHLAQHYLDEQVEEVQKSSFWVNMIESFGETKDVLLMIDNKMGEYAK